jgi:ribosomal protein S18 acetylase RimI-like enzyme
LCNSNPGYTVRPAQVTDLDRLVELLLALQNHLEGTNPDLWQMKGEARDQLRSQIAARLVAANSCALVAEHDRDGVVGVVLGRIVTNNRYIPDRAGLVDQVYVRENHRRRGIASWLMVELCHFFAGQGVDDLSLRYVVGNEEAAGFWEALGFAQRIVTAGASRQVVEERLGQTSGS